VLELHMLGLVPTLNCNSRCEVLVLAVVTIGLVHNVANLREEQKGGAGAAGQACVGRRAAGAYPILAPCD
jgi:hypothetical protein